MPVRAYTSLARGARGVVFVTEAIENQPGSTLHRYDLKKRQIGELCVARDAVQPVARTARSCCTSPVSRG